MVLVEWIKIENEKMFHSSELDLGNKAANHFNLFLIKLINLINKIYKIIIKNTVLADNWLNLVKTHCWSLGHEQGHVRSSKVN